MTVISYISAFYAYAVRKGWEGIASWWFCKWSQTLLDASVTSIWLKIRCLHTVTYDLYALLYFYLQRQASEAMSKGFQKGLVTGVLEWSPADICSAFFSRQKTCYLQPSKPLALFSSTCFIPVWSHHFNNSGKAAWGELSYWENAPWGSSPFLDPADTNTKNLLDVQVCDWLFSSNIQINFHVLISLSRKLETPFSPSLQSSACPVLPLPVASLGCKHLRHSLSPWCVCVTPWPVVTCPHLCPICRGYWSVIAPSCWPGFPPQAAENPAFIARLVPVSTLVLAKMASAIFVQSRTKLALITARNVIAIKIRRKAESESPAWETWLCCKSLMGVCIICSAKW